jgi:hypothetical protein
MSARTLGETVRTIVLRLWGESVSLYGELNVQYLLHISKSFTGKQNSSVLLFFVAPTTNYIPPKGNNSPILGQFQTKNRAYHRNAHDLLFMLGSSTQYSSTFE